MSSKRAKLQERMRESEADLRALVVPALLAVQEGATNLFVTKYNNPWPELKYHTSQQGEPILEMADEILRLAEQLGIDDGGLLARKVKKSFLEANDLNEPHRFGPRRRAQLLLDELRKPAE